MDILENILTEIKKVDTSIQKLTESSTQIDPYDSKGQIAVESAIDKARGTKVNLIRLYHSTNQDINLKNEEIEAKIEKLRAEIKRLEDGSGLISKVDLLIAGINWSATEGIDLAALDEDDEDDEEDE